MRKELEIIEKIEAYLQGQLPPADMQQFEAQLSTDKPLQAEVELQRQLMTGIQRAGLRQEVLAAKKSYLFRSRAMKWGIAGVATAALVTTVLYYRHQAALHALPNTYKSNTLPTLNEGGDTLWTDADKHLPAQTFLVTATQDTVIETRKGIVLSIPAHAFLDEDNRPVKGNVQVVVKEALTPTAIMTAGLSTRSGDQLLSTGGMFFVDARQESHILHIDTTHPILTQIPAKKVQAGMQLYKGRRKPDGTIDWVDPRPLEHRLTTVDIRTLDFYPRGYLGALRDFGEPYKNRAFTDSLYYSLTAYYQQLEVGGYQEQLYRSDTSFTKSLGCGLDPAKIKTIWSPEFQHTFIATREFEQRLRWLHIFGRNDLLDIYVSHLDWSLSSIDSLVASQTTDSVKMVFQDFASRHDGKVDNSSVQFRQLTEYFQIKARIYAEAISRTEEQYWARQKELDKMAYEKRDQHLADSFIREDKNFSEEFNVNLKAARQQLGYYDTLNCSPAAPDDAVYTATLTATGWYNVDKAVMETTLTRTTLNYQDPSTGRQAVIRYLPVSFQVAGWETYDRLYIYLLPDQLSSFMLVSGSDGNYTEKLNELMKYRLVCIGYKGDKPFYYQQSDVQPKAYAGIRLDSIASNELTQRLSEVGSTSQAKELQQENSFFQFDIQDEKRQVHNFNLRRLQATLEAFIFRCRLPEPAGEGGDDRGIEQMPMRE